jgi:hypothetical protein
MKKYIIVLSLLTITAAPILSQAFLDGAIFSSHQIQLPPPPYDGKTPPPLKLDEAYAKALSTLGDATNQYYCVSATSLNQVSRVGTMGHGFPGGVDKGWMFAFSSTNGTSRNVYVYFDKAAPAKIEDPAKSGF